MAKTKVDEALILKMVRLRNDGKSTRQIGEEVGLSFGRVAHYLRKHGPDNGARKKDTKGRRIAPSTAGGPPPEQPIGQVVDATDIDGTIDLLQLDRFASPDELAQMAGLDPTLWIPTHFKPNSWQGYGRVKEQVGNVVQTRLEKVQLFQSKATFKRIIEGGHEDAIRRWMEDNVKAAPFRSKKRPERVADGEGQLLSWGIWDAHLGQYTWGPEVGSDSDINQATRRVFNSIDDMRAEVEPYPISRILMPIGNDFMHFDSVRMTTTHGSHFLDTDSRYAKIFLACPALPYLHGPAGDRDLRRRRTPQSPCRCRTVGSEGIGTPGTTWIDCCCCCRRTGSYPRC